MSEWICKPCQNGEHADCEAYVCQCVCNDYSGDGADSEW